MLFFRNWYLSVKLLLFSAAVSDDREQIPAHLQLGRDDPVAGTLGRMSAVAGACAAGVSTKQLVRHRRASGISKSLVSIKRDLRNARTKLRNERNRRSWPKRRSGHNAKRSGYKRSLFLRCVALALSLNAMVAFRLMFFSAFCPRFVVPRPKM